MAVIPNRLLKAQERLSQIKQIQDNQDQYLDEIQQLENTIISEKLKEHAQAEENVRRKHDYTPFIIELLKKVAQKGYLEDLIK